MSEIMYHQSSYLIAVTLFVSMALAIEIGYRIGRRVQSSVNESSKAHVNTVQASLLGILALLLGFTFSLSLQRYDNRSQAVVEEANAIGTAYLRAQLLPPSIRGKVQETLRDYLDLRVHTASITVVEQTQRQELLLKANQLQDTLWRYARKAVEEDPRPVTTGLFIQSLNELIDSYGRRDAALSRHIPEIVLFLLYAVFLIAGSTVGFASGVAGHRASFITYIMVALIVLLVFIIIDLDRPRRGLIEVSQKSLTDLQTILGPNGGTGSERVKPADVPR